MFVCFAVTVYNIVNWLLFAQFSSLCNNSIVFTQQKCIISMISMFRFLFVIAYSQYGGGAILNDKQRNKYNINFYFLINWANIFTDIICMNRLLIWCYCFFFFFFTFVDVRFALLKFYQEKSKSQNEKFLASFAEHSTTVN